MNTTNNKQPTTNNSYRLSLDPLSKKQPRIQGFRPASLALERFMTPAYDKMGDFRIKLIKDWDKIVGDEMAAFASPGKVIMPNRWCKAANVNMGNQRSSKNFSILEVIVSNSGAAVQLSYNKNIILEKIKLFFGYEAIGDLKIVQNITFQKNISQNTAKNVINKPVNKAKKITKKLEAIKLQIENIEDETLKSSLESFYNSYINS